MAGLNYYVKLPDYNMPGMPDPARWIEPIGNGLMELRKRNEFDATQALKQQHLDIEQQRADREQAKTDQELEDKRLNQAAGIAQYIHGLKEDDPQRAQLWNTFVNHDPEIAPALKSSGLDPTDHVKGPQFVMAKIAGYQDSAKKALLEAQTAAARSHGAYYDAAGRLAEQRGSAVGMNAETRRLKAYGDLVERMGPNPTREDWEREGQAGGLVHAAFGGPVPFERAQPLLIQAQATFQRQFEPDAEEKALGITREDKIRARREERINEMYGAEPKTLIGKGVRMTPSGDFSPRKGASTVSERQGEVIARNALDLLNQGEETLKKHGTLDHFFGDPESTSNIPGAKMIPGGFGETGQGYRKVKAAIIDLNFALSGKSVSNKEREAFLDLYMPRYNDSAATQKQKMGMVRNYFTKVMDMRNAGASDDEVAAVLRNTLNDNPNKPPATPGGSGWSIKRID